MNGLPLVLTIFATAAAVVRAVWAVKDSRKASRATTPTHINVRWGVASGVHNQQGVPVAIVGEESQLLLTLDNSSATEGARVDIRQPKAASGIEYRSTPVDRDFCLGPRESRDMHFLIVPSVEGRIDLPAPAVCQLGHQSKKKVALPEPQPLKLAIEKPSAPLLEVRRNVSPAKAKVQEVVRLSYHLRNQGNRTAKQIEITPPIPQGVLALDHQTHALMCPGYGAIMSTFNLRITNHGVMEFPEHLIYYEDHTGDRYQCSMPALKLEVSFRPATHLLARDAEMVRLREVREELLAGRGRLVVIPGEAGGGKSRLVEEFLRESEQHDLVIVKGDSVQMHQAIPLFPFRAIATQLNSWLKTQGRPTHNTTKAQADSFDQLSNGSWGAPDSTSVPPQESQLGPESIRALTLEAIQRASQIRYMILCLEDIHWCDSGSLDLIELLALKLAELPVLIIATYRVEALAISEQERGPFSATLHRLRQRSLMLELPPLKPFSEEQTRQFVSTAFFRNDFPPYLGHILHEETGGNPLFLFEVLELLREKGIIYCEDGQWRMTGSIQVLRDIIPSTVEAVIRLRLDCLSEDQRTELQKASILGRRFPFPLWREISGRPEDDLVQFVEDYMNYQLVQEEDPHHERLAFTHAKIQEVIYANIRDLRRRRMHQRAAEVMEERLKGGDRVDPAELAQHYYHAADHRAALPYLIQSARVNNMVNNTHEARQDLLHAEQCIGELGATVDVALVLEFHNARGESFVNTGDYGMAMDSYRQCIELARRAGNKRQEAWALNMSADIERHHGNYSESEKIYEQCRDLAKEAGDSYLLAETTKDLGLLLYRRAVAERSLSQWETAAESLKRAQGFLMQSLDYCEGLHEAGKLRRGIERQACNYLGIIKETAGQLQEAEEYCNRCLQLTQRYDLSPYYVHDSYGELRRLQGRLQEAEDHYKAFLDYAITHGLRREEAKAYNNLGVVLLDRSDYDGASRYFDLSLEASAKLGARDLRIETLIMKGMTWAYRNQAGQAVQCYRESLHLRALSLEGEPADALRHLAEVGTAEEVYREVGEELLARGQLARAQAFLQQCLADTPDDEKAKQLLERCRKIQERQDSDAP